MKIEAILDEAVDAQAGQNNPPFESSIEYAAELEKREVANAQWSTFTPEEQKKYSGRIELFYQSFGVADLKSDDGLRAKNAYLLRNEIHSQIQHESPLTLLSVEELHFSTSLLELLENVENIEHIRDLYKLRKRTVGSSKNAGVTSAEAQRLKNSMRQGRELYLSGRTGSLMVKPLNFFIHLLHMRTPL